jgi:hypothetical protein
MRRGDDGLDAVFGSETAEINGLFEIARPIVDSGEAVMVNIDHYGFTAALRAAGRGASGS